VRIAVVGPEGTGKTMLAAALADAFQLPLLASLREPLLHDSGYHTLFEWVAAGHSWAALVAEQARREAAFGDGVVDGGVLEQFCLFQRWGWNATSPDAVESLREAVLTAARRYDRILVTPPRLVAGPASARFRNSAHNLQLARLLDALVREGGFEARTCALADAPADARVVQARSFVAG
jgi:hypothetical protein